MHETIQSLAAGFLLYLLSVVICVSQTAHVIHMHTYFLKISKESRLVEGVEASQPVAALLRSADSHRCLHPDNRKALSPPRSLLKADPSPHRVRGVTPDASASASFTEGVKSVQGAGLRSGSGEVAEERESRGGVKTLFDAGDRRPRAGA